MGLCLTSGYGQLRTYRINVTLLPYNQYSRCSKVTWLEIVITGASGVTQTSYNEEILKDPGTCLFPTTPSHCHNTDFTLIHCPTPFFLSKQKLVLQIYTVCFIRAFILRFYTLAHIYRIAITRYTSTYFNSVLNYSVLH